jgi:uncharacterized protein YjbI with pentapeptide repeats
MASMEGRRAGAQGSALAAAGRLAVVLLAGCLTAAVLWKLPEWQVSRSHAVQSPLQALLIENALRQTWGLLAGAGLLVVILALVWRQIAASRQTVAATQRLIQAVHDGQCTERFSRAVEQLASERLEVRVGAVYAMERIARESETDHWPVIEVLCAYVRERAAWRDGRERSTHPATDVQAVLTVLGRRVRSHGREGQRLDLRRTDLRGADLSDAHLEGAHLVETHLEHAGMQGAHLERADLREAALTGADLVEANLRKADLREAHLESAYLVEAHLEGADLGGAHLEGAYLGGAFLEGADLGGAHLDGAYIYKAHLNGASLQGARILTAIGMNREQRQAIDHAVEDDPPARRTRRHGRSPGAEGDDTDDLLPRRERA